MLTMLISLKSAYADNILAKEYFIKAAFLYNFARLVEWPKDTFISDDAPIRICLMGNDSFDNALNTIRNKKVRNQKLIIQRGVTLNEVSACHILFISTSEENNLHTILRKLKKYPLLTVSDIPDFAHKNGHIHFYISSEDTLSLEVNQNAIIQSGLKISSRILTLAKIVSSDEALQP